MTVAKNLYLTRPAFRSYLKDHEQDAVFWTRRNEACPVAAFLFQRTGRVWSVNPLACVPRESKTPWLYEFRPPRWARDFIHVLDLHYGRNPKVITGEEALYVLDEAVR